MTNTLHVDRWVTVWQPWAALIAANDNTDGRVFKTLETRYWPTEHRGLIGIHAGMKKTPSSVLTNIYHGTTRLPGHNPSMGWINALGSIVHDSQALLGYGLAVANIVDCRPMMKADELLAMREFDAGLYVWRLENIRRIKPVPIRGKQRFFNDPLDVEILVHKTT